jgi:hypothetical protein
MRVCEGNLFSYLCSAIGEYIQRQKSINRGQACGSPILLAPRFRSNGHQHFAVLRFFPMAPRFSTLRM